jgi:dienelactone hydrolase
MLDDYLARETKRLSSRTEGILKNTDDWAKTSADLRRQLFEMLGLQPLPARSDLKAEVTGISTRDGVIVEKVVFQSKPGLYVTANFYRPEEQSGPLPTILYLCGHGREELKGMSVGNKVHYQHHGAWFAKNGYTCLMVDTLQLGEIEGIHHGTNKYDRWWWNTRGYTPAGVEAWNGIRALDYLESRPEVDASRFGVTGRSGGGAYSWYVAALDERIKVAAPVAGITSMQNHIVDGCIEGHCDCMFMVNTYRWDFPLLASLVAPRPLLIGNTDKDRIFPLDGVLDVYTKTRQVYESLGALDHIGLAVVEGPHADTQPLRVPVFAWFDRFLKGAEAKAELADAEAPALFTQQELKVLESIPENERNTFIDEYFVSRVPRTLKVAATAEDWGAQAASIRERLRFRTFRAWPTTDEPLDATTTFRGDADGIRLEAGSFSTQAGVGLPWWLARPDGTNLADLELVVVNVLDEEGWKNFSATFGSQFPEAFSGIAFAKGNEDSFRSERDMHASQKWGMLYLPPRGIGPTAWSVDEKDATHIRRRFALLGQTIDEMRIWDIRRGIALLRGMPGGENVPCWLQASGPLAGDALYAALYTPGVARLDLHNLSARHEDGPELLNVLRFADLPQIATMVGAGSRLRIYTDKPEDWKYLEDSAKLLGWPEEQVQLRGGM